ncbi:MAG TPA: hypothetical protein VNJ01_10365 [Bacteriovoracaceae bacterium]|nr:hypothetical protein [Bacteriovoracaceae bacterium]
MKFLLVSLLSFSAFSALAQDDDCHPDFSTNSRMICVSSKGSISVPSGSIAILKDHKLEDDEESASFEEPGKRKGRISVKRKKDKNKVYTLSRVTKRYEKDELTETYQLGPQGGLRSYTKCDRSSLFGIRDKNKCLTVNHSLCGYVKGIPEQFMKEQIKQCKDAFENVKRHTDLMKLLSHDDHDKDTDAVAGLLSSTSNYYATEIDTLQGLAETVYSTSEALKVCKSELGLKLVPGEEKKDSKKDGEKVEKSKKVKVQ